MNVIRETITRLQLVLACAELRIDCGYTAEEVVDILEREIVQVVESIPEAS